MGKPRSVLPVQRDTWDSYADSQTSIGRQPDEHVTNSSNELDVQSAASKSGKRQRAEEDHPTSAATEKDTGNQNEKAKKDHPEAPGPVIGMNDERGGVCDIIDQILPSVADNI